MYIVQYIEIKCAIAKIELFDAAAVRTRFCVIIFIKLNVVSVFQQHTHTASWNRMKSQMEREKKEQQKNL